MMSEHFEIYNKAGWCPHCGRELTAEEGSVWRGYRDIHHSEKIIHYTGRYYCIDCDEKYREQLKREQKEKEQKEFDENVKQYNKEYEDYLEIREQDNLYTLNLTIKEVQALRLLINQNDTFKELDLHHAFKELDHIYLYCDYKNNVTPAQRKCIDLIEKKTKHKFYGKTLLSARLFISKYIEESKRG